MKKVAALMAVAGGVAYLLLRDKSNPEAEGVIDKSEVEEPIEVSEPRIMGSMTDPKDTESLARMFASENPRESEEVKIEQAYTQVRQAQRHRRSLYTEITGGTGEYGNQGERRPVSTDNNPSVADTALAARFLAGRVPASALPNAHRFFHPSEQDRAYAQVVAALGKSPDQRTKNDERLIKAGYKRDAEGVRTKWRREGKTKVGTVSPIEFWT